MTKVLAFECYADGDVIDFLLGDCRIPLKRFHAYGQGEVVNAVFVRKRANVGLVDEDPLSSHHRERDKTSLVRDASNLQLRRQGDRFLILLRPDLEACFLRGVSVLGMTSKLPARAPDLHGVLNVPNTSKHDLFRAELRQMHEQSKRRNISTFIAELEGMVCELL